MDEVHDPYAALRHRDYRYLLGGGVLASMGTQMQAVAVGWELYERTDSHRAWGWSAWCSSCRCSSVAAGRARGRPL